jgi:hypothetical protein
MHIGSKILVGSIVISLVGCAPFQPRQPKIVTINGMSTYDCCGCTVARRGQTTKVTLPSVSASGVSINLGALETNPATTGEITNVVYVEEDAIIGYCNLLTFDANNGDRERYNQALDAQQIAYSKLLQLAEIIAEQPAAPKPSETPEPSQTPKPSETPKPKSKAEAETLWAQTYGPANAVEAIPKFIAIGARVSGSQAPVRQQKTTVIHGEHVFAAPAKVVEVNKATVWAIPLKANSFFDLSK